MTAAQRLQCYKYAFHFVDNPTHGDFLFVCPKLAYEAIVCGFVKDGDQNRIVENIDIYFPEFHAQKPPYVDNKMMWWPRNLSYPRVAALNAAINLLKQNNPELI